MSERPLTPPRWDLDLDALAASLAPLSNATRLRILNHLVVPRHLEEVADFLRMNRSAARKHLDQLVEAGFATRTPVQRGGSFVVEYSVDPARVFETFDTLRSLATLRPAFALPSQTKSDDPLVPGAGVGAAAPCLVEAYGVEVGKLHPLLGAREAWALGRDADVDIPLAADPFISGRHAILERAATGFALRDLGSRNGTFVDGSRLPVGEARALANGSILGLGHTLLVFRSK